MNLHNTYRGQRVLVTGHNGFKGSWLSLWLHELGAKVHGVSLAVNGATDPLDHLNHFRLLELPIEESFIDINDGDAIKRVFQSFRPSMVFHLAAQPLVRRSYRNPQETWSTNVMGTVNVLEACRGTANLLGIVVVTSDKCYQERDQPSGYTETDALGGLDPYSASKGAAELVVRSYRHSFFGGPHGPLIASARAGNVIGGGDWGEDRLIPDAMRAVAEGRSLEIRQPKGIRPWQHVLDCLSGYLLLGEQLLKGNRNVATAWNFGGALHEELTVTEVLEQLRHHIPELRWHTTSTAQPRETPILRLDSTRARRDLGWKPAWDLAQSLFHTAQWYRVFQTEKRLLTRDQLHAYLGQVERAN